MTHAFVLVLVPPGTGATEIQRVVAGLLEPYNWRRQVGRYKEYSNFEQLQLIAEVQCVPGAREMVLEQLLSALPEAGEDELGPFLWTTANPRAKWDRWRIGGRYDGVVQGEPRREDYENLGAEHERVAFNTCPVERLPRDLLTGSLVTPDGEWHEFDFDRLLATPEQLSEEAKDRLWQISVEEWAVRLGQLLLAHRGCLAVGVDCHS